MIEEKWTFCSDEEPTKEDTYIVLWNYVNRPAKKPYYEIQNYYDDGWDINIPQAQGKEVEIIAWQELPALPEEA